MANNCWFVYICEHAKKTVSIFCAKVNATPSAEMIMELRLVGRYITFYFLISDGLKLTSSGGTGERLRASTVFYCLLLSLNQKVSCSLLLLYDSCLSDRALCVHLRPLVHQRNHRQAVQLKSPVHLVL